MTDGTELSFYNIHGTELHRLLDDTNNHAPTEWLLVGRDPSTLQYFDDDNEARDSINWRAMLNQLDTDKEVVEDTIWNDEDQTWWMGQPCWRVGSYKGVAAGVGTHNDIGGIPWVFDNRGYNNWPAEFNYGYSRVLIVREGSEAHETVLKCLGALADYPILNDSEYSEREYEAWQKCWKDFAKREVAREVVEALALDGEAMFMLDDFLSDSDEWDSVAGEGMSYYHGFSGEYDSDGARDAVIKWLGQVMWLIDAMCDIARPINGVHELPLMDGGK